jgi:hypothetical protein
MPIHNKTYELLEGVQIIHWGVGDRDARRDISLRMKPETAWSLSTSDSDYDVKLTWDDCEKLIKALRDAQLFLSHGVQEVETKKVGGVQVPVDIADSIESLDKFQTAAMEAGLIPRK